MRRREGVIAIACAAAAFLLPASAGARTKTVYPSGPIAYQNALQHKYGAGVNNFLLNTVTINVGDTVVWDGAARTNGFHTIDLPGKSGTDLPFSSVFPGKPVSGVKDSAGNLFWFNGQPSVGFNPALLTSSGGHKYSGSERVDSGLPLGPPQPFKVTFTKPGVYKYFCDVHYGMVGYVVVRAKGKRVPSAAQDKAALASEEIKYAATAKKVDKTTVRGSKVSVGASGPGGVEVFAMFPATLRVKVGTVVTFSMSKLTRDTHTVTFGDTAPGGYVYNLGQTAFTSPIWDPRGAYPSDPPPGPLSLSPTSHGNGFANSGPLDRDTGTPLPPSGQIKFTQPGTYHYICLIHPFMHGTVIVK
jgi:plastocyanin